MLTINTINNFINKIEVTTHPHLLLIG